MSNIFSKFTKHYKKILESSEKIAEELGHDKILPVHLLYTLSIETGAVGFDILHKLGLTSDKIRQFIPESYTKTPRTTSPQISKEVKDIIVYSVKVAFEYEHKYVGTEHLLAAILNFNDDTIKNILNTFSITTENIKNQIDQLLASTSKFNYIIDQEDTPHALSKERDARNSSSQGIFGAGGIPGIGGIPKEEMLELFANDLTDAELQETIDPVVGREFEIERLIQILSRRTKNNPVLIGEPGVGKTAIIEGLAKKILAGDVPSVLIGKKIYALDLGLMIAGTTYRGEFENRLKQFIEEIKNQGNVILFIDELHTIVGTGSTSGSLDVANMLKPELARGDVRIIGATTPAEYKKHIEDDRALERRFQTIFIDEPNTSATITILKGIKNNYEKYHRVAITDSAIEAAVHLSARYITNNQLPDKAIDLIDEAAAKIKIKSGATTVFSKIQRLEKQLDDLEAEKEALILNNDFNSALSVKQKEHDVRIKLASLYKQHESEKEKMIGKITEQDIAEIISCMFKIPLEEITSTSSTNIALLSKNLKECIIGQEEAIDEIVHTIKRAKAGINNPHKPLASFVFLGPSGVGKTATAKAIARQIFNDEKALIQINMTDFSEGFTVSKLVGSPAGYVGYKESALLTDSVRKKPYSVVLFDEIEKAHPDVFNILLPILEEGEITDATGRTVNFRNTIIIMTSNIGSDDFNRYQREVGFSVKVSDTPKTPLSRDFETLQNNALKELRDRFRPEFLNRIDQIIVYHPLNTNSLKKIIKKELGDLKNRILKQKIELSYDNSVISHIFEHTDLTHEGARNVGKTIDREITTLIADRILQSALKPEKMIITTDKKTNLIRVTSG